MERPERPSRHRSNPIVKPNLPFCPSFSSDSDSEQTDNDVTPIHITYYQQQPDNESAIVGPSTSSSAPQTNQSTSEPGSSANKLNMGSGLTSYTTGVKTYVPRPLNVTMSPLPASSQEGDAENSEPQTPDPIFRCRKRSAATMAASSAAASVLFESVESLIGSNTNNDRATESPERQEFQHSDFVIRPRSFCNIEYCNSSGARVPYKHKRLNAPIDLTSSLPSSSSSSSRPVGNAGSSSLRNEVNESYLNRVTPTMPYGTVPQQRREVPQQASSSSSILRQFDEMMSSSSSFTRKRPRFGFNVRFCDNSNRLNEESSNDESSNIPFLNGESSRPRSSNLDDYCDLVGNFLFNFQPSTLHTSDNPRNSDTLLPLPPRSPPPSLSPLRVERIPAAEPQSSSAADMVSREISDIMTNFMGLQDNNRNTGNDVMEIEQSNDDVIVVETNERLPLVVETNERPPLPDSPGPYIVPSSATPSPVPVSVTPNPTTTNKLNRPVSSVPMTLQELNQTLVSLLECPVCLDHATPPIFQCCKGHILCQNCHPRLSTCPICRSRLPGDRNSSMEKVAEKLMYPCKNTVTGCSVMLKLVDKQEHEEGCGFRHYTCIIATCHWKGYKPELVVHLQSNHPDRLINAAQKVIQVPLTMPLGSSMNGLFAAHHWIQAAHNEVFNVIFHVDLYKRIINGCVSYIGAAEKAGKFRYTFELNQRTPPEQQLIYSRTTHADIHKPGHPLSMVNEFRINIDIAREYRAKDCTANVIPISISVQPKATE